MDVLQREKKGGRGSSGQHINETGAASCSVGECWSEHRCMLRAQGISMNQETNRALPPTGICDMGAIEGEGGDAT